MRRSLFLCGVGLLFSAAPAAAQFGYEEHHHKAYQAHWHAHPERPEIVIDAWHRRYFGGPAPGPWVATWMQSLRNGATLDDVLAAMLASDEFYSLAGSTPAGLVRAAFTRLVGRPPTEQEFAYWLNRAAYESRLDFTHDLIARYPPAGVEAGPIGVPSPYEYRPPIWHYRH
jgi:hypothetical protein